MKIKKFMILMKKMKISQHRPFLLSIFGGIFVWFFLFLLFPAKIVNNFSNEAFLYIIASYVALVLGYFIFPKNKKKEISSITISKGFIYSIIVLTLISFLLRYIDLFLYRKVSFTNTVWQNRALLSETNSNFLFIIASVCKQLYFIPIIFIFKNKIKDKKLLLYSLLLFLLPFIEGYIRGSRNGFFMPMALLFIIFIYFNRIRFQKKDLILILTTCSILFIIATSIIINREASKTDNNYTSLTTSFFLNDFLKPNPQIFKTINSIENQTLKKMVVSGFQFNQYYVHGVFEFDNLVKYYQKEAFNPQYGKYTFFVINRFTNKYGLSKTNLEKIQLLNPRKITFITFFGGLYLDFGWLGIIIMILYGSFQRFLVNKTLLQENKYLPLLIFLLFCNFFMLTFNFIKNTGTYILIVCFAIIFSVSLWKKLILKKK